MQKGIDATFINARFAMPFDESAICELAKEHRLLVTMEENGLSGGFGEHIISYGQQEELGIAVLPIAIPDAYVEHGNVEQLKRDLQLDAESIVDRIINKLKHNEEL